MQRNGVEVHTFVGEREINAAPIMEGDIILLGRFSTGHVLSSPDVVGLRIGQSVQEKEIFVLYDLVRDDRIPSQSLVAFRYYPLNVSGRIPLDAFGQITLYKYGAREKEFMVKLNRDTEGMKRSDLGMIPVMRHKLQNSMYLAGLPGFPKKMANVGQPQVSLLAWECDTRILYVALREKYSAGLVAVRLHDLTPDSPDLTGATTQTFDATAFVSCMLREYYDCTKRFFDHISRSKKGPRSEPKPWLNWLIQQLLKTMGHLRASLCRCHNVLPSPYSPYSYAELGENIDCNDFLPGDCVVVATGNNPEQLANGTTGRIFKEGSPLPEGGICYFMELDDSGIGQGEPKHLHQVPSRCLLPIADFERIPHIPVLGGLCMLFTEIEEDGTFRATSIYGFCYRCTEIDCRVQMSAPIESNDEKDHCYVTISLENACTLDLCHFVHAMDVYRKFRDAREVFHLALSRRKQLMESAPTEALRRDFEISYRNLMRGCDKWMLYMNIHSYCPDRVEIHDTFFATEPDRRIESGEVAVMRTIRMAAVDSVVGHGWVWVYLRDGTCVERRLVHVSSLSLRRSVLECGEIVYVHSAEIVIMIRIIFGLYYVMDVSSSRKRYLIDMCELDPLDSLKITAGRTFNAGAHGVAVMVHSQMCDLQREIFLHSRALLEKIMADLRAEILNIVVVLCDQLGQYYRQLQDAHSGASLSRSQQKKLRRKNDPENGGLSEGQLKKLKEKKAKIKRAIPDLIGELLQCTHLYYSLKDQLSVEMRGEEEIDEFANNLISVVVQDFLRTPVTEEFMRALLVRSLPVDLGLHLMTAEERGGLENLPDLNAMTAECAFCMSPLYLSDDGQTVLTCCDGFPSSCSACFSDLQLIHPHPIQHDRNAGGATSRAVEWNRALFAFFTARQNDRNLDGAARRGGEG